MPPTNDNPTFLADYSGDFDPKLDLGDFDHGLLATYGREVMLANHIHDRSALMPVALHFGIPAQTDVACDEWMSASPIYNRRNRACLKIVGDDVGVALKSLQVDIGAPHNFLNFHYELCSADEGYFWTNTCGPYLHVRKISSADEGLETQICHHMEDPTFDATVMAVNPLMRCRPVYRPPYEPGDIPERGPCKWQVSIQREIGLVEDCPNLATVESTLAARFEFAPPQEGHGLCDYSGPFRRDFRLEDLAHDTLANQCKEFLLHVFLLNYACYTSIAERFGQDAAQSIAAEQWRHLAPITVHRLRKTFRIEGNDLGCILKVMQLNPFFPRDYLNLQFKQTGPAEAYLWLDDCAAYRESVKRGLVGLLLTQPEAPGFDALAQAVNPHAGVRQVDPACLPDSQARGNAKLAWKLFVDVTAQPAVPSEYANLVGAEDLRTLDNSDHVYRYEYYDTLEAT